LRRVISEGSVRWEFGSGKNESESGGVMIWSERELEVTGRSGNLVVCEIKLSLGFKVALDVTTLTHGQ
jgi:hypothetical protein